MAYNNTPNGNQNNMYASPYPQQQPPQFGGHMAQPGLGFGQHPQQYQSPSHAAQFQQQHPHQAYQQQPDQMHTSFQGHGSHHGTPVAHHNSGPGSYPAVFGQTGHQDASQPGSFGSGLVGMGVPAQAKGMNAVSKRIQAKGQGLDRQSPARPALKDKNTGNKVNRGKPRPPKGAALTKFLGSKAPNDTASAGNTPLRLNQTAGTPQPNRNTPASNFPTPQHNTTWTSDAAPRVGTPANDVASRCVTVFGFNPDAPGTVLCNFEMYGTIEKRQFKSGKNWMHLKYASKKEASKAKNMHGTKFDDSIMIAVQPCTDIDFIGSNTNTGDSTRDTLGLPPRHTLLGTPANKQTNIRRLDVGATPNKTPAHNKPAAPQEKERGFLDDAFALLGWGN